MKDYLVDRLVKLVEMRERLMAVRMLLSSVENLGSAIGVDTPDQYDIATNTDYLFGEIQKIRALILSPDDSSISPDVPRMPCQPLVWETLPNGQRYPRFKANRIVQFLLENGGLDLNKLVQVGFPREDWQQFYQLIGYSLAGFAELGFDDEAERIRKEMPVFEKQP